MDWQNHRSHFCLFLNDENNNRRTWVSGLLLLHWLEFLGYDYYRIDRLCFWTRDNGEYLYPLTDFRLQLRDYRNRMDLRAWSNDANNGVFEQTFSLCWLSGICECRSKQAVSSSPVGLGIPRCARWKSTANCIPCGFFPCIWEKVAICRSTGTVDVVYNLPNQLLAPNDISLPQTLPGFLLGRLTRSALEAQLKLIHPPLESGISYQLIVLKGVIALAADTGLVSE